MSVGCNDLSGETAGALIRAGRERAGLSLRELSARAGVSHVYLGKVERGGTVPAPWRLIELSLLLGIAPCAVLAAARADVAVRAVCRWEAKR